MEATHPLSHRTRTVHDHIRILIKRRWTVLTVFVVFLVTAGIYSFVAVPQYKGTVQILIERQIPGLLEQPRAAAAGEALNEEFYQTQYKLLGGRALAKKVIDKLQLQQDPHYSYIFKKAGEGEAAKRRANERLITAILDDLEVNPIRQSRLVEVSFFHEDPKFAAKLINTLARCYIEQSLDFTFAASQEAATWLKEKMADARKKLEESETRLNQYKREQNIVTMEDKESITAQKLEQVNKELVAAQTRRIEAETRFKEVSKGKPISQILNNPLVQTLKGQEAKIIAEHSELSRKYGPDHPRMIQLNNELAATRGKIAAETHQVVEAIKNEYHMALSQEENLRAWLNAQKAATQDLGDRSIQYRVLLRDVETNRALYENVLKSLKTTTATENRPATNIRIVYPATVPVSPVTPRKGRNLLLGGALGLILGMALALGLENLDTTLTTPDEVEHLLGIPNLAIIPHLKFSTGNPETVSPELIVHHESQPLASEYYRVLRTSVLFSSPESGSFILLVTSSLPGEGKTLTVANLATAMAKTKKDVLLVDSDLRRPTLHQIFEVNKEPGLSNFLMGELEDLPVIKTQVEHLYLVPSGVIPPNPSELIGSKHMEEFLSRARERYSRVILDSPPLLSVTDSTLLAAQADGVLMVVKAEIIPRKAAQQARDKLLEVKANLLGVVLNDIPLEKDSYYYKYYQYYSHYHRAYVQNLTREVPASNWFPWKKIINKFHKHLHFPSRDSSPKK
jgi:succinoglycan biosynthesis transport protein ExoP